MSSLETLSKLIIKEFNTDKELQETLNFEELEKSTVGLIKSLQRESTNSTLSEIQREINHRYSELLGEAVYLLMLIRRNKSEKKERIL